MMSKDDEVKGAVARVDEIRREMWAEPWDERVAALRQVTDFYGAEVMAEVLATIVFRGSPANVAVPHGAGAGASSGKGGVPARPTADAAVLDAPLVNDPEVAS